MTPAQFQRFRQLRDLVLTATHSASAEAQLEALALVNQCEAEATVLEAYRAAHKGEPENAAEPTKPCRNPACRNLVKDVAFCTAACREVFHAMRMPPPTGVSVERLQELLHSNTPLEELPEWLRPCDADDPDAVLPAFPGALGWPPTPAFKIAEADYCAHESCPECAGSGKKRNGETCIHYISCPCPKHTARF